MRWLYILTLFNLVIISSRSLGRFLRIFYIENYVDCQWEQFFSHISICRPFLSLALLYWPELPVWYWIGVVSMDILALFLILPFNVSPLNFVMTEYDVAYICFFFLNVLNQGENVCWELLPWINVECCQMFFPIHSYDHIVTFSFPVWSVTSLDFLILNRSAFPRWTPTFPPLVMAYYCFYILLNLICQYFIFLHLYS